MNFKNTLNSKYSRNIMNTKNITKNWKNFLGKQGPVYIILE